MYAYIYKNESFLLFHHSTFLIDVSDSVMLGSHYVIEHYLFHILAMAPKCKANVCAQWMMSFRFPGSSLLTFQR